MSLESAFYTYIGSFAGITALIGSTPKLYPDVAPLNAVIPYVVYRRIGSEHVHHLTASAGLAHADLQIDVYDDDKVGVLAIAEQFRLALEGMNPQTWDSGGTPLAVKRVLYEGMRSLMELREEGGEDVIYRMMMQFQVWFAESVPSL